MDTCCYKRAFDDQTQDRVYLETETIFTIIAKCDRDEWKLLSSKVLEFEFNNDKDVNRRKYMINLFCQDDVYPITESIKQRASEFQKFGVKLYDSLHLATAKHANADMLLTVDDQFISSSKRTDSNVNVVNPANIMEVL
jgi:predicted nucleic acid-binding protein